MNFVFKSFLLLAFSLGLCSDIRTDETTNQKIESTILAKLALVEKNKSRDITSLKSMLETLKKDLTTIINKDANPEDYAKLKSALEQLNPDNLFAMLAPIKTILGHVSPTTRSQIKAKLPSALAAWL